MQTFKKILFSSIIFLLLIALFSSIIIIPWLSSEYGEYMDSSLRKNLAGKLNYIVIGASHALTAFVPPIIDAELDCFSYNLSSSLMALYNRIYLLNKELNRNPVKTVVIEVAYDTLTRPQDDVFNKVYTDTTLFSRLDNLKDRNDYLKRYLSLDECLNLYCQCMQCGLSYWKSNLLRENIHEVDYSAKGFLARKASDISLPDDEIESAFNSRGLIEDSKDENIAQFCELIELCKQHGCNIAVIVTPISDGILWKSNDIDIFEKEIRDFCDKRNILFYDFNLLKERQKILSDKISYYDDYHMSVEGATAFTQVFCDCMKKVDVGEDISNLFYTSYEEAKQHSPYMEYYKAHCND